MKYITKKPDLIVPTRLLLYISPMLSLFVHYYLYELHRFNLGRRKILSSQRGQHRGRVLNYRS